MPLESQAASMLAQRIGRKEHQNFYGTIYKWCTIKEMRLTVNLDPDVYSFASAYASARGITLSAALGEMIRRAEQAPQPGSNSPRLQMNEHGYLEITATGDPLTPEMVKEAAEDELV